MNSRTTERFWKCYAELPIAIKKQAKKAYKQFQAKDIGLNPVMGKGAVSGKPDYLDQAYKIGTNLVKYNEIRD